MMSPPKRFKANGKGRSVYWLALIISAGFVKEDAKIVPPRHSVSRVTADLPVSNSDSFPVERFGFRIALRVRQQAAQIVQAHCELDVVSTEALLSQRNNLAEQ